MNDIDVLTRHARDLVHHVLQSVALALYAAATVMLLAMLTVMAATGDFPGRWWVGVAGVLAAAVVIHVRSIGLPTAPRASRSTKTD